MWYMNPGTGKRRKKKETEVIAQVAKGWVGKIALTVTDIRKTKDIKQDAIIDASGVSRKSLSALENAKTDFRISMLVRTLLALDVDIWALFGGARENAPKRPIEQQVLHDKLDDLINSPDPSIHTAVISMIEQLHPRTKRDS